MSTWWQEFFDDEYAAAELATTPPEQIARIVNFVFAQLVLEPGQIVFDQCCGIGRLAIPLAERGVQIIGVDQAASYINRAQQIASARHLTCQFVQGDARKFITPQPCDAALNWFTSFGYSSDDAENAQMLQRAFDSLKPGGRFILDYQNFARILSDGRPCLVHRPEAPMLAGLIVLQESQPNFTTGMMESDWTFVYADGRRWIRRVATKMYLPHALAEMARGCGFEEIVLLGSADVEPFERTSRRCILVARKP